MSALVLPALLCACSRGDVSGESDAHSEPENALTQERASELVASDREVTEMFVNCSLISEKTESLSENAVTGGYSDFASVEALLSETYSSAGGSRDYFLAYPSVGTPSLSEKDGRTYAFYHPGSGFDGFIEPSTVSAETDADGCRASICGNTPSGERVTLSAVYENDFWLLEKGIYRTLDNDDYCILSFPMSGMGSCSAFSGKVLIVELYLSGDTEEFDSACEEKFHSVISRGVEPLIEASEKYGGSVEVTYANAYFEHSGVIASNSFGLDMMFSYTAFETLGGFIDANFDLSLYDSYAVMVCRNIESGTTCNMYEKTAETELYYCERLLLGSNSTGEEICSGLLRMFGAYDYSDGSLCGEYHRELYASYFPDDIFLCGKLSENAVSPVSAFAAGITHDLSPLFRVFWFSING